MSQSHNQGNELIEYSFKNLNTCERIINDTDFENHNINGYCYNNKLYLKYNTNENNEKFVTDYDNNMKSNYKGSYYLKHCAIDKDDNKIFKKMYCKKYFRF